jgi:dipeptidyl aminopeptidase/acylaminoacyl peptidase
MTYSMPSRAQDTERPAFDLHHIASLRQVSEAVMAPDGGRIAYVVSVPRDLHREDDGPPWSELYVTDADGGAGRAFIQGQGRVSSPAFTPDGRLILFLAKRGEDKETAIWAIPVNGGEARKVIAHETSISGFAVSPTGRQVAFRATEKKDPARTKLEEKGFDVEVFEENLHSIRLWMAQLEASPGATRTQTKSEAASAPAFDIEGSVFDVAWSGNGEHLAVAVAPTPLVDDSYMAKRVRLIAVADGATVATFDNPGKLGAIRVAPDGAHIAMISGADYNDPKNGRLLVAPTSGDSSSDTNGAIGLRDLLPGFEGHFSQVRWRDAETLVYVADIGVETELGTITLDGTRTPLISSAGGEAPVILSLSLSADGQRAALRGSRPTHPPEVFSLTLGTAATGIELVRRSESNPWLANARLAPQRVETWRARDGMTLEGMLIEPVGKEGKGPHPLIFLVHGGPESHVRNGWTTSYNTPTQLLAAEGFAVFHPNYRGSTGRGVAFSKISQGAAAGPEFEDLVDAIDHLVEQGIAKKDQIGFAGGSYGGYATAWMSTRYSDRVRAGVMFNGISNKHSKALTTDIPLEDRAVHTLYDPWTRASFALERSPISYVADAQTPLLIANGKADTRVHPSQSLQLYRALKLVGKAPVRFVRYPGEPHGNRRQASREDYTRRLLRWMKHFILDGATELPATDIDYGLPQGDDD